MSEFQAATDVVEDRFHGAKIMFLDSSSSRTRLELIEPMGEESPLTHGLERGGGVHHLCFQVATVEGIGSWCKKSSIRKVFGPYPAPAFGGRKVVFVHSPGLGLIEFVETKNAIDLENLNDVSGKQLMKSFLDYKKLMNRKAKL
jgi:methylmalonyl-CoA/ethylmalonyl-CoA epimerase